MALPAWAQQASGDEKFSAQRNVVASGISYNLIAAVFQILGSLVSIIIMSRLLTPEDFGVHGMIVPYVTIFVMLADGGSVYYALRLDRVREATLAHAFWYCGAIGFALMLVMALFSPVIANIMDEPRLIPVAMVMGVGVFFTAAGAQHMALIMRCFRNDLRTWVIVGSVSAALAGAVAMAWLGWGYWALVMLFVMRSGLMALFSLLITGWVPSRPRPFQRPLLREIARLGTTEVSGRVLISGLREVDRILAGILFTTAVTGFYSLAYMLSTLPLLQLLTSVVFVILPFISEMKDEPDRFWAAVQMILRGFIFVIFAWCIFASLFAEELLVIFIGAEMMPAAEIFQLLILSGMLTSMINFISIPFQAVDRPDITRRHNFRMIFLFILPLAAAAYHDSPQALALAVLISNFLAVLVRGYVLARHFQRQLAPMVWGMMPVIAFVILGPLVVWSLDRMLISDLGWPHLLRMAVLILALLVLQIACGWVLFRDHLIHLRRKPAGSDAPQG